jgi:hypothetical protein
MKLNKTVYRLRRFHCGICVICGSTLFRERLFERLL